MPSILSQLAAPTADPSSLPAELRSIATKTMTRAQTTIASPAAAAPMGVAQLTSAMAAGDAAAIEQFYRRWFTAMFAMARRAVGRRAGNPSADEAMCLDVVHDAMLRIVRCVRPMQTDSHLTNWTRLVIQSCALDRLRGEQRRRRREAVVAAPEDAGESPVHGRVELDEQVAWLSTQVSRLEPGLARLIHLRFTEGWTLARIAATLRTSTGQVDGRLRRAIAKLRADAAGAFDADAGGDL